MASDVESLTSLLKKVGAGGAVSLGALVAVANIYIKGIVSEQTEQLEEKIRILMVTEHAGDNEDLDRRFAEVRELIFQLMDED